MWTIARLIHLNGAPGIGKSSLARRYLDDHPLALLLEVDALRTSLGRRSDHEESKVVARDLALALADRHFGAGYDVVVPQLLARPEFIEALEGVALRAGAGFIEVLLEVDLTVNIERFWARRSALLDRGEPHPQADVLDHEVEEVISAANDELTQISRPGRE